MFYAPFPHLFGLTPLSNLHHFLICVLSFSVQRPLAGCALGRCWDSRLHLKCDGIRAETRFRLSAKRTSPFKPARASVQSTTGSRGVRISGSNAGYIMSRGSVKGTGYPLHSPVSPSLPLTCVTVCHHISTEHYNSHSEELNWEGCAHCKQRLSLSARRLDQDTWFICIFLSFFCSAHKRHDDTPNRGTKMLTGIQINAAII